jgi:ribosome-binding protein aMBF1 (putative translation factor)
MVLHLVGRNTSANTNWQLAAHFGRFVSMGSVYSASRRIYQALGEAVRAERMKAGLSQEQLAERVNLTRNYIGHIERAEKKVTLEVLAKLAKVFKCRVRDLVWDV